MINNLTKRLAVWAVPVAMLLNQTLPVYAGDGFTRLGDFLEIALPGAALICAGKQNDFKPALFRFVGQEATVEALKYGLQGTKLDQRPNGGTNGFPSGHTAAAFYGASYLARNCLDTPVGRAVGFGLAALVGASRVTSDSHTTTQVVAGALIGMAFDRVTVSMSNDRVNVSWRMRF